MRTDKIEFNGLEIVHLCKPNLKNSYIAVKKDGIVILKTPKVSYTYIENLLLKKESWIRKQLKKIEQNPPKIFHLQDEILLFGKILSIDCTEAFELRECLSTVNTSNINKVLQCYDKYYSAYAKSYITQRARYYSRKMSLNYGSIAFKKMKSRWGSCSTNKIITFNTELIKIDKRLIDFVVVHELAHLVHMNHSKEFHNLVNRYISNSRELHQELKYLYLG